MKFKPLKKIAYLQLVVLHIVIAIIVTVIPVFAKVYSISVLLIFLFLILKSRNKNNEVLVAAAYFTSCEVFLRMTNGGIAYEFGKYVVIGLLLIGLFYRGASSRSGPYWLYLILLTPGILFAAMYLNPETNVRNTVLFNLTGPVCLGLSAIYCYRRSISTRRLQHIILALLLPVITMTVYLFFNTPDIGDILGSTQSNHEASGGFGPNQVATTLGIGIFVLLTRLFYIKNKFINILDLILLALVTYRGLVTFSRGGIITGLICAIAFVGIYFLRGNIKTKAFLIPRLSIIAIILASTFAFTAIKTSGLITNRYTNKDAAGRLKTDITTGRAELITSELKAFYDKPITGIGIGKIREYRYEKTKILAATHNEFSRLLSEHGILGIVILLILVLTPLLYRFKNRRNNYFYAFLLFWALTISHSSMRIAAPAFIYGLCLLNVTYETSPLRRKQTSAARLHT